MENNAQFITMNKLTFNKTYSYLKDSCLILNKELLRMKEKNQSLNQKVEDLKSTISSILQRTVTKEEMKEIITSINLCKQIKEQHPSC